MEGKNLFAKRGKDNSFYQFELIGFNEVYVHDNQRKEIFYVDRTFGAFRCKIEMQRVTTFEAFKSFSCLIYTALISSGDGMLGSAEDASLKYELDMRTIALGMSEILN